jgi:hypothetical protein
MVIIITFFKLGNNMPIFRIEISVQEWEIAMLCIINKYGGNYPFINNMCDEKYIKEFWTYFNIRDGYFDVIEYEGIFITGMRVEGYDTIQFASWKNSLVFTGVNKRKRDGSDDGC